MATSAGQPRCSVRRVFQSPVGPDATPLQRFAHYCDFDPRTGCVVWTGGTTAGRGNSAVYGSFKDGGRRWFAHRWAAVHIHGLDIEGVTVGHCCPHTGGKPNTLCVQHVRPETLAANVAAGNRARVVQGPQDRQFWLFVQLGLEPAPAVFVPDATAPAFYEPPAWFLEARPDYVLPPLADTPF